MRHRTATLLGLASLFLALSGDSCLVEERTVDVVVKAEVPAIWHTQGTSNSGSQSATVNANSQVESALNDLSADAQVTDINVAGVCYEVLANRGIVARHTGSVSVDGHPFIQYDVPSNATGVTGGSEGAQIRLVQEGVNYINNLLDQYVAGYRAGGADPALLDNLLFAATWSSDQTPVPPQQFDFDWKTCLILQVIGNVTLDVPNP